MDAVGRGFPPGDIRVSDADRDRALAELGAALRAGRITADEFDERSEQALGSRTGKELSALLADLPLVCAPAAPVTIPRQADHPLARRVTVGASVAAVCFAGGAVISALAPGVIAQQREIARQLAASHGLSISLPPASGFNWAGTLTPAVIAVLLVVLVICLRVAMAKRT
jgi:hypothetical protein